MHGSRFLAHAALVTLLAAGCGGDTGPQRMSAEGLVTVDNQPLPSGMIRFVPTVGTEGPAAAAIIQEGKFSMDTSTGPIVGTHRVEIEATGYQGFAIDDERAYAQAALQNRGRPVLVNPIPDTYNRRSTLTRTVIADGPNSFEFNLQVGTRTASR